MSVATDQTFFDSTQILTIDSCYDVEVHGRLVQSIHDVLRTVQTHIFARANPTGTLKVAALRVSSR